MDGSVRRSFLLEGRAKEMGARLHEEIREHQDAMERGEARIRGMTEQLEAFHRAAGERFDEMVAQIAALLGIDYDEYDIHVNCEHFPDHGMIFMILDQPQEEEDDDDEDF